MLTRPMVQQQQQQQQQQQPVKRLKRERPGQLDTRRYPYTWQRGELKL